MIFEEYKRPYPSDQMLPAQLALSTVFYSSLPGLHVPLTHIFPINLYYVFVQNELHHHSQYLPNQR
jgi:hypothetical protein